MRIGDPLLDAFGQLVGRLPRTGFALDLVALLEQPVEIGHAAPTGSDAHQRACSLGRRQLQGRLSGLHQRLRARIELAVAGKEPIPHHFLIARRQNTPQLSPASMAQGAGESLLLATEPAAHIHVHHLPVGLTVVSIPSAKLSIDAVHRLFHLSHIRCGAVIERLLHHRLLRTELSSKGQLQGAIRTPARIDFDQALRSRKPRNEAIRELVVGVYFTVFCPMCTCR